MNAKWYVLTILVVLFFTNQANAQYQSVKGFFELDQQLGCHDLTVNITSLVPNVIAFQYDGFDSPTSQNTVHTYSESGSYWINHYHQGASGDERKDSILVTVVTPELPDIELLSCNNLELLVDIHDNYYDVYEINYGDGTIIQINKNNSVPIHTYGNNSDRTVTVTGLFTTATNRCAVNSIFFTPTTTVLPAQIDSLVISTNSSLKLDYSLPLNSVNKLEVSINNNSSYQLFKNLNQSTTADTLSNLNISQTTYCFRIATYDACSNFKSYSNEVCTINLNTSAQNNQITIDWKTLDLGTGQTTTLLRDNSFQQSFSSAVISYIDSAVICNTTYCYQAEITYPSGAISRSIEFCETAFSTTTPPTIDNISSVTNADSIEWTWEIPINTTPAYYMVYQVTEDGTIINSDSTNNNLYKLPFNSANKYLSAQLYDICNNNAPIGNIGSNINLTGNVTQSYDIELNWNNYFGWIDGFQDYYLTIKSMDGALLDSVSTNGESTYTLEVANQQEQTMAFTVWAVPELSSIRPSRSNILFFEREPIISIPNSFTPNGDGLNDQFIISGKFINTYELQIFNRWGEVLYQTNDLDSGWDGTSNGKSMPVGNYAYWMRIKDLNDNEHIRTGSILILSN